MNPMQFSELQKHDDGRTYTFKMVNSHVTYANTLRRLILTGVETVAFRADMTSTGSTTDVSVKRNDTPMTNEMLADRIGLLPIHVKDPQRWNNDEYQFTLKVDGDKDRVRYVTSADFKIKSMNVPDEDDQKEISSEQFFPRNPLTGQTCLIAALQPGVGPNQQSIEIVAKATKGTGREHARFCPVSQCSYEYTLDTDPQRLDEMFVQWLAVAKKVVNVDKASDRYAELQREFNTMQRKRCFLLNAKGEPFSFDFTVESVGVLDVSYIVERACEVAENICLRYVNLDKGDLPDDISLSTADSRVIGYDFLFRGHDHTLGNLFQTWMVENLIETANPTITYVGYSVPHPLRDEMVLRVGVENGKEASARGAVAAAAKGCQELFRNLRTEWRKLMGVQNQGGIQVNVRRRTPIVGSR
uniref:DNA-directed RNA polymerase RpoA/D/Rpb3-type domain-containing protein n=1 Tax=viral metagenome TaxID=1070528 RepID=A0A6C0DEI0_9ZZZZ